MGIVEELESSIDIVDLVSKYTTLKKSGVNYKSVCPFPGHSEKTPSFMVSKSKQLAYCFGCHKGGGPVKFVMDIENCEFKEAIEILGNFTGVAVNTNFDKEKFETKKSLYSLYKDSVEYYKQALKNYPEIRKYLLDRGLSGETIEKFHFGYADSGVNLYNHLRNKGYDDALIDESKIFVDIRSRKDKFIGRIIFPIQNQRGDFVALAGRITGEGEPKYLNSPITKIYDKSNILYGLYNARNAITKEDFIIVTEGYMDTIALQEAGFFNTVCVSGTALTEKHLSVIKRLTHKVYLCFDGDKAGEKATKLALELMKNKDFEVKIILLPKGKDPDDIIKSGKDFGEYIKNAVTPIGYYIKKTNVDLESIEEKKKILSEILDMIHSYSDNIEKDFYLKEVSKLLDIHSNIIYDQFNKKRFENRKSTQEVKVDDTVKSEDIAIAYILSGQSEEDEKHIISILKAHLLFLEDSKNQLLKDLIENTGGKAGQEKILSHLELQRKEKYRGMSLKIESENEEKTGSAIETEIIKIAQGMNKEAYKKKVENLKNKMNTGDSQALQEYSELIKKAKELGLK